MTGIMRGNRPKISKDEVKELTEILGDLFIQRWDIYSRQTETGYVAIKKPLTKPLLTQHLLGMITLGVYLLDIESNGRCMVLDADDEADWRRLQALAAVLNDEGCVGYLEQSRRGGHLWLFFEDLLPGVEIRLFGRGLLAFYRIEGIELFPKQDFLGSGPGSQIRLPFGIHRKSGKRYGFLTPNRVPLASTLRQQIRLLSERHVVPGPILEKYTNHAKKLSFEPRSRPETKPIRPGRVDPDAPIKDQIEMSMPVRQFVLQYVELSPGGKGLCPFHDDTNPSFNVNDRENYWYCFACETGGGIVNFWMRWRNYDFKTAVDDLAQMLLIPARYETFDTEEEEDAQRDFV